MEISGEQGEKGEQQLPGLQQLICHLDTNALGGPGPAPNWTQSAVLAEVPPLSGSAVTPDLAARA